MLAGDDPLCQPVCLGLNCYLSFAFRR